MIASTRGLSEQHYARAELYGVALTPAKAHLLPAV